MNNYSVGSCGINGTNEVIENGQEEGRAKLAPGFINDYKIRGKI